MAITAKNNASAERGSHKNLPAINTVLLALVILSAFATIYSTHACRALYARLQEAGKTAELFLYENDNHNLSNHLTLALQRSLQFFDEYVKGE